MDRWNDYSNKEIEQLSVDELIALRDRIVEAADALQVYDGHPENWDYEGDLARLLWDIDDELASRTK